MEKFMHPREPGYIQRESLEQGDLDWVYAQVTGFLSVGGLAQLSKGRVRLWGDVSSSLPPTFQQQLRLGGTLTVSASQLNGSIDIRRFVSSPREQLLIIQKGFLDNVYHTEGPRGKVTFLWKREKRQYIDVPFLPQFVQNVMQSYFDEEGRPMPQNAQRIALAMLVQASHRSSLRRGFTKVKKHIPESGPKSRVPRKVSVRPRTYLVQERHSRFETMTLTEIAHEARSGDREALAQLYVTYSPKIYQYLYRHTGDTELAQDITTQVFITMLEKVGSQQENFSGWLFRIARNALVDAIRAHRRRYAIAFDDGLDSLVGHDGGIDEGRGIDEQESIAHVLNHVDRLRPDYQRVLYHWYVDEYTQAQIAEVMGKSEDAVKVLLHRAKKRVKELMERDGSDVKISF